MMGDEAKEVGRNTMLKASSRQKSLDIFLTGMENSYIEF